MRESANLVPPGPTPTSDQERRSLVGTLQRSDPVHQLGELGLWDVARHALRDFGQVTGCYNRIWWRVLPAPSGDVAEEHRQAGKSAPLGERCIGRPVLGLHIACSASAYASTCSRATWANVSSLGSASTSQATNCRTATSMCRTVAGRSVKRRTARKRSTTACILGLLTGHRRADGSPPDDAAARMARAQPRLAPLLVGNPSADAPVRACHSGGRARGPERL